MSTHSYLCHTPISTCTAASVRWRSSCKALLCLILLITQDSLRAATSSTHAIDSPSTAPQRGADHGSAVAKNDNYLAVAAPDTRLPDAVAAGVVNIYNAATGEWLWSLKPTVLGEQQNFGTSVALSGSRVVVGSVGAGPGRAYVFDLAGASPTVPMLILDSPTPVHGRQFGHSVAVSGDWIVVGDPMEFNGGISVGRVYVFNLNEPDPTMPFHVLASSIPGSYHQFGAALSMSGSRLAVSEPGVVIGLAQGRVGIYDLDGPTPTQSIRTIVCPEFLGFPDGTNMDIEGFGETLSLSGDFIAIGAPNSVRYDSGGHRVGGLVRIYSISTGTATASIPGLSHPESSYLGQAVALDGQRLVIGDSYEGGSDQSVAHVYDLAAATPNQPVLTLDDQSSGTDDRFGAAVAVRGTRVLVGNPENGLDSGGFQESQKPGSAKLYDLASPSPEVPQASLINPLPGWGHHYGSSVALVGRRIVVGAPEDDMVGRSTGSVYIHNLDSASPQVPELQLHNPSPHIGDGFGMSVAAEGTRIVVGAPRDGTTAAGGGRVYVYDRASPTPTVPVLIIENPGPAENEAFGRSVAISGSRIVVATRHLFDLPGSEAVYVYDLNSASPALPVLTLDKPPQGSVRFGSALALAGSRLIVGDSLGMTFGSANGLCFVYDLDGAFPAVPTLTISNPVFGYAYHFGAALSLSGNRVAVGAPRAFSGSSAQAGEVFVFDLASLTPATPVFRMPNPSPALYDYFGTALGLVGDRLIVGGGGEGSADDGLAISYLFDLGGATPQSPAAVLSKPRPDEAGQFGSVIAASGDLTVIAAPIEKTRADDRGAIYLFQEVPSTGPVLSLPANQSVEATSASGAIVTYPPATATDSDGVAGIYYSHASGTLFPRGVTTVTVVAVDNTGITSTGRFTLHVQDTLAPALTVSADLAVTASSVLGTAVFYSAATATDAVGVQSLTYSHASGAVYLPGVTTVTVTAQDAAGNTSTRSFTITVSLGASGGSGLPDVSLAGTGQVSMSFNSSNDYANAVAVQSDGRMVLAGTALVSGTADFALQRYLPNGTLDPSFDGDGMLSTGFATSGDFANAVIIQPDGKIIAGGAAFFTPTSHDFALARYTASGALDTSFGSGGKVTTVIGNNSDQVAGLCLQPDGKIIAVGSKSGGTTGEAVVVRYLPNGTLDSSFGTGGKAVFNLGAFVTTFSSVKLQPDGRIVVGGSASAPSTSSNYDFVVARLLTNGTLDTSFNGTGSQRVSFGTGSDICRSIDLNAAGGIVMAGYARMGDGNDHFALARCDSSGALDPAFGTGGMLTTTIGTFADRAQAVAIQTDGRIVVGGSASNNTDDVVVARYLADGALDTSFGNGGVTISDMSGGDESGNALALAPDGRIVVAGRREPPSISMGDFLLMRFLDQPPKAEIAVHHGTSTAHSLLTSGQISPVSFSTPISARSVIRDFLLVNPGTAVLTVSSITAPSGFQVLGAPTQIHPGATAAIQVRLGPNLPLGAYSGDMHLLTNDLETPDFSFPITGQVISVTSTPGVLNNAGFEIQTGTNTGVPVDYGYWSYTQWTEIVTSENGISPSEVSRMIKFVATNPAGASGGDYSEIGQLVDVRHLADAISEGRVTATLTASFNRVAGGPQTDTGFYTWIAGRGGHPSGYETAPEVGSSVYHELDSDADPGTWEQSSTSLDLMPGTEYLDIFLGAFENVENNASGTEFDGHYADAATLVLTMRTRQQQWRQTHFGTTANTANAADTADPDHDGVVNAIEFATGGDPWSPQPFSHSLAPGAPGSLEFTYTRAIQAAAEFSFIVEWSDALLPPWSSAGVTSSLMSTTGVKETIRAVLPAGATGRRFVRLRLEPLP